MSLTVALGVPTKVINAVNLASSGGYTEVDIDPLLGLFSQVSLQVNPASASSLVGKLSASLDGVEYNIHLAEVGSPYGFTNKTFGPLKHLRLRLTNYDSSAVTATAWICLVV